jgi:glyoxylase-like metal-dependent hydrolase (beta-lactamase superfamily II)
MPAGGTVRELGDGRLLVDLGFRDSQGLIASYLLPGPDDGWTVVETGPGSCGEALRAGVSKAGIAPEEVRRVFVTHIHLDHAGGLGAVASAFPRARLYAHRAGVTHLADPSRLVASARRAWGEAADVLWGPVIPVPSDRLVPLDGGERFPLRTGELEVIATPGHAIHHLSFFDSARRAVMTGDSAGIHLEGATRSRPAIPPPDLDLEVLFDSLDRMAALDPLELLYAHFGSSGGGAGELRRYRIAVEEWRDVALQAARTEPDVGPIAKALRAHDEARPVADRSGGPAPRQTEMISGYEMAAMGLLRYFRTRGLLEGPPG